MKKRYLLLLPVCIFVILAGFGLHCYTNHYVWVAGSSVSREAETVDLRGRELTVDAYRKLREKMPQSQILWDVPFQGGLYDSTVDTLQVTTLTAEDLEILDLFPELICLDASRCTDYDALMAFRAGHPSCEVRYFVSLGGGSFGGDTRSIHITDPDLQELKAMLPYLPDLQKLRMDGQLPEPAQLEELRSLFPDVEIHWELKLGERTLSSKLTELYISGLPFTCEEVEALLQWLPDTKMVEMRGCGPTDSDMIRLADSHPDIFFVWDMTIGQHQIPTNAEEVDVSGYVMQSTSEIEELLPYFRNVKKVVMSHCGFDDETMDTLNKKYDDIRFVWSIQVQDVSIRTDTTFFYPFKYHRDMVVDNDDLYPLRYCTDIVAVDIGHMWGVTDCEWAAFMPNLKYLILVETQITDLSPLSNCKNLLFLEIFKTRITDYSPLLACTALEDINMCRTYGDYAPIAQMTWLKNIWWNGIAGTVGYPCSGAEHVLPEALPNTNLVFYQYNNSHRNGWRDLQNYMDMRDVMGMFYLR